MDSGRVFVEHSRRAPYGIDGFQRMLPTQVR
jgi:hypothetical protein